MIKNPSYVECGASSRASTPKTTRPVNRDRHWPNIRTPLCDDDISALINYGSEESGEEEEGPLLWNGLLVQFQDGLKSESEIEQAVPATVNNGNVTADLLGMSDTTDATIFPAIAVISFYPYSFVSVAHFPPTHQAREVAVASEPVLHWRDISRAVYLCSENYL
ncbi:hypothetical protein RR48_01250 [Papilio machaon]|uniref:Uncharacterized protein n=1 Tax=Papilio machaon TaxID=76193 RepID=A0A0N0PBD4_PAPMA|nr:hypothetical protein RR48_01250 [Papilio machaon]